MQKAELAPVQNIRSRETGSTPKTFCLSVDLALPIRVDFWNGGNKMVRFAVGDIWQIGEMNIMNGRVGEVGRSTKNRTAGR